MVRHDMLVTVPVVSRLIGSQARASPDPNPSPDPSPSPNRNPNPKLSYSYHQLSHWHACAEWGGGAAAAPAVADCDVFTDLRPKTVALSVLVTIEMFNALNALSENESLIRFPPWRN